MAATFLTRSLMSQSVSRNQRGERKVDSPSFLREAVNGGDESEAGQLTMTSSGGHDLTSQPRTIASPQLFLQLSPLDFDTSLEQKASQLLSIVQSPHLYQPTETTDPEYTLAKGRTYNKNDEMAVAPHLRKKKERASVSNAATPTEDQVGATGTIRFALNSSTAALNSDGRPQDIRTKLERDYGIKVSQAKATNPPLVNYTTSTEGSPDMTRPKTTVCNDRTEKQHMDGHGTRSPDLLSPSRHVRGGGRGRGRGQGRGRRGGGNRGGSNNSRWPTSAEQRPDPHRWDTRWSSPSKKGSAVSDIDSDWADAGGGPARRRKADEGGGYQLADFHGGWAPAPVDWDSRPAFRDSQSASQIQSWLSNMDKEMPYADTALPVDPSIDDDNLAPNTGIVLPEFAPRYWIPAIIDSQSPQNFWNALKNSDCPRPFDLGDLIGVKPWWTTYQNATSLGQYDHPTVTGPSPDERQDERIARENDLGSNYHTENRRRRINAQREAKREQRKKAQQKIEEIRKFSSQVGGDACTNTAIKPKLNLYIRYADHSDSKVICDLYNHYVSNSVSVAEGEPISEDDIKDRLEQIRANKLPFLVAYQRGGKLAGRKKTNIDGPIILPDKLVGFALADEYHDKAGLYRFTASIEVYVNNESYMQGVASCLLDKLLGLLDPAYVERKGFDVEGDEAESIGATRIIKTLVINVSHDRPEVLEWKARWLEDWLGFKQAGYLHGIGYKYGKGVNLAIFQRETGV